MIINVFLDSKMDLDIIHTILESSEYNKNKYYGLVYRINNPKITACIFRTGRILFMGAKSMNDVNIALDLLKEKLVQFDVISGETKIVEIKIENIVATAEIDGELDLEFIATNFNNSIYEPEQFPSIIYKPYNNSQTIMIFRSGKIVFMGYKTELKLVEASANFIFDLNKIFS
jgi:transcription initiation factor TFIID TATA-box-binding protein